MPLNAQDESYLVEPYLQIGRLKFGLTSEEVKDLFGEADQIKKTYTGRISENRGGVAFFYRKNQLEEVSFLTGAKVTYNGHDLLSQEGIDYLLNNYDHKSDLGFTVFPSLGISFTGFGDSLDEKTVSVFTKEVLQGYLEE